METVVPRTRPLSDRLGQIVEPPSPCRPGDLDPDAVRDLFRRHGAVLFRGFEPDVEAFQQLTDRYCREYSTYQGGGLRYGMLDRESLDSGGTLLTVSGHRQSFGIPLHGEMYYLDQRPAVLWFYCQVPPAARGETTVCDGAEIHRRLSPRTREFFADHRIRYSRRLRGEEWRRAFQTDDLEQVRAFCAHSGMTMEHLAEDDTVLTDYVCSAVVEGRDGAPVFINNLVLVHTAEQAFSSGWVRQNLGASLGAESPIKVRTEDGAPIPEEIVRDVEDATARLMVKVEWRAGDILMVDNTRVLHGREKSEDKNRSILVRMGQPAFEL